ncbi:MAG TPA: hypothetical protein VMB83_12620 [Roseiarcus sp.]|nr:hypothetical protein [Roseiarcus sp.]
MANDGQTSNGKSSKYLYDEIDDQLLEHARQRFIAAVLEAAMEYRRSTRVPERRRIRAAVASFHRRSDRIVEKT